MKPKTLNLTPWQAKAADEKRLHRIIVPMNYKQQSSVAKLTMYMRNGRPACKCPFSVGDVVCLKESSIRHHFHVKSIEAKMLGEVTEKESEECGISPPREWMNSNVRKKYDSIMKHFKTTHFQTGLKVHWQTKYHRSPKLSWSPDLWVWSLVGEVKV